MCWRRRSNSLDAEGTALDLQINFVARRRDSTIREQPAHRMMIAPRDLLAPRVPSVLDHLRAADIHVLDEVAVAGEHETVVDIGTCRADQRHRLLVERQRVIALLTLPI